MTGATKKLKKSFSSLEIFLVGHNACLMELLESLEPVLHDGDCPSRQRPQVCTAWRFVQRLVVNRASSMLVLFETPAGYALFKVLDESKLRKAEDLYKDFVSLESARNMYVSP